MLRAFFSGSDVPESLVRYKALFDAQRSLAAEYPSNDFQQRVLFKAGIAEEVEAVPRRFSLLKVLRPFYNAVAAIAVVMLAVHVAQATFGTGDGVAAEQQMADMEQADTTNTPTLETLRAVGNGQTTATASDTLGQASPEQMSQPEAFTK